MGRLLTLLAFAPALATGLLVFAYAENVPVWDDFERAPLLAAFAAGEVGFEDLYELHIDHRIVVPRLFILANAWLTRGNLVFENALAFGIVVLTALALAGLLRRTLAAESGITFAALLGVNLLVFSPLQWENFLWAIQTAFVLPMACVCLALLVLESKFDLRVRFALAAACAVVGTHSFSHGMFVWLAVPAWLLAKRPVEGESSSGRGRRAFLGAWLVVAAAFLVPYFTLDYQAGANAAYQYGVEEGEPTPIVSFAGRALQQPLRIGRFYLSMIGSPLARLGPWEPVRSGPWWGALVHGLLGAALVAVVVARDRDLWNRSVAWLAIAGVSLTSCFLAALGRAIPVNDLYAMAPRYVSISQYALVALVGLGALLAARGPRLRRVAWIVGACLLLPVADGWKAGITGMRAWQTARLQARTSLLYIHDFEPRFVRRLDQQWEHVRRNAEVLDRHGFLDPPLARERGTQVFQLASPDEAAATGRIEQARGGGNQLVIQGSAVLAGGRPDHGVLLVLTEDGGRTVVAIGEGRSRPAGPVHIHDHIFSEVERDPDEPTGLWKAKVDAELLPADPTLFLDAFVVDAGRMQLHPLAQRVRVSRLDGTLRAEVVDRAD